MRFCCPYSVHGVDIPGLLCYCDLTKDTAMMNFQIQVVYKMSDHYMVHLIPALRKKLSPANLLCEHPRSGPARLWRRRSGDRDSFKESKYKFSKAVREAK